MIAGEAFDRILQAVRVAVDQIRSISLASHQRQLNAINATAEAEKED